MGILCAGLKLNSTDVEVPTRVDAGVACIAVIVPVVAEYETPDTSLAIKLFAEVLRVTWKLSVGFVLRGLVICINSRIASKSVAVYEVTEFVIVILLLVVSIAEFGSKLLFRSKYTITIHFGEADNLNVSWEDYLHAPTCIHWQR